MLSISSHRHYIRDIFVKISSGICMFFCGCLHNDKPYDSKHFALKPKYDQVTIQVSDDTIKLAVDSLTSNKYAYFNFQNSNAGPIFSFFDKTTSSINIYNLRNKNLIKQLKIGSLATEYRSLSSTKTYFKSFDSIYVYTSMSIYRIDTSLNVKDSIKLLFTPYRASSYFRSVTPAVFIENNLYLPASPTLDETRRSDLNKWKLMYKIDWAAHSCSLFFPLPVKYRDSIYQKPYLAPFYCFNSEKNLFVFSFPIDSNIYSTNFKESYLSSYVANSQFIRGNMRSYKPQDLVDSEKSFKASLLRDNYGPIYYDFNTKRYIRVTERKISAQNLSKKQLVKEQSLIILNEDFQVVGESEVGNDIDLFSIFITNYGIYARTSGKKSEDTIYLVKLSYNENLQLANKK